MASGSGQWGSSLFGCFEDITTCLIGYFVPCVLYGQNVEKMGEGDMFPACCLYCCCPWFTCLYAAPKRGKLRAKYNLPEEPFPDILVHIPCLSACAVCQEARELARQGK